MSLVVPTMAEKMAKGEEVNHDNSGLSKREWNELMVSFNFSDNII